MSEWISVKDELPRQCRPVLGMFSGLGNCVAVVTLIDGVFVKDTFQAEIYGAEGLTGIPVQPDYWMPLPPTE